MENDHATIIIDRPPPTCVVYLRKSGNRKRAWDRNQSFCSGTTSLGWSGLEKTLILDAVEEETHSWRVYTYIDFHVQNVKSSIMSLLLLLTEDIPTPVTRVVMSWLVCGLSVCQLVLPLSNVSFATMS